MLHHPVQQDTDPLEGTRALSAGFGKFLLDRHTNISYGEVGEESWGRAGAASGDTLGAQGNGSSQRS